jgi:hypothetical protein
MGQSEKCHYWLDFPYLICFPVWVLIYADLSVMETQSRDVTYSSAIGVVFSKEWSLALHLHDMALKHEDCFTLI